MNYIDRGFEWESIDHATNAGAKADDALNDADVYLKHAHERSRRNGV